MVGRRSFLFLGGRAALGVGTFACSRSGALPTSCVDESGLTDDERAVRSTLAYVDRATAPDKACRSCQQWITPKSDGACGGCKLLKGPVHPLGSCKAFAARS